MYDTTMSSSAQGKTRCPVCDFEVWNWHIKRHMLIHVDSSSKEDSGQRPHIILDCTPGATVNNQSPDYPAPHQFVESTSLSWDTPSNASDDSKDETCLSNTDDDDFAGDDGLNDADMFGDEMDITVDSYITTLTDKYDPKKVLKYLSWSPRPLTVVEQESIRFLRNLSFGAGMSRAHSQEWLDYTRDLGGALSFCFQIFFFLHTSMCPCIPEHLHPTFSCVLL
jgi:hypothetical protein